MYMIAEVLQYVAVASFAEAWIEIVLKPADDVILPVASFAEAWIEIISAHIRFSGCCRLLRGGVD